MAGINPEDIGNFVWRVAADIITFEARVNEMLYLDRYSIALLGNPSLFEFLDAGVQTEQVVNFIADSICSFKHVPCDNAGCIEALLSNPNLYKMIRE